MTNPRYRQIAEDLRAQIASGDLAARSRLPTESDLKERYSASRNTVRDAVKWLASLGLVETRPGPGTFVVEKHERRFIDSHPWSMQTSYYPMEFADLGAERLRSARDIVDVGNASDVKAQENTGNQSFRAKIRSTRLNQPDGSYEGKEHG